MKKALIYIAAAAYIASSGAYAGERILDSGLGGASGAIVFGPVGAIAGGVIGYAKGPSISRAMGLGGRHHRHTTRQAR